MGPSFKDVFVSPELSTNLISVRQLVDDNCDVHFSHGGCIVQDQVSGMVIAKGPKVGRLFPLYFSIPNVASFACMATANNNEVWHKKLGHPNFGVLTHLLKHGFLGNNNNSSSFDCATCRLGKSKTLPFPVHGSRASTSFEIVHTDVWGASPITSHGQHRYFVTFIDDYSRFTWIYFLRSKADVFSALQRFVALVETQFSTSIKILRFDSGGEYMSHAFQNYLQQKGIISQRSCPYTYVVKSVPFRSKNRHKTTSFSSRFQFRSVPEIPAKFRPERSCSVPGVPFRP